MSQEMLNIRELYKDVRVCSNCRMAINKSAGCNKVMCTSCGQLFCFRCCKTINGYDHFKNCRLFEAADMTDWDKEMIELQNGIQMRAQKQPLGGTIRCPKCRETNFKDDEKYVFCWACRTSYCTLCKRIIQDKILKRGHWGSPECVGFDH
uniref:RBR-type E3 ubiquitin transferase n=1 Tax=Triticum urartu TaxID=4572 RepID=A0A8R7PJN0_TRIUA